MIEFRGMIQATLKGWVDCSILAADETVLNDGLRVGVFLR